MSRSSHQPNKPAYYIEDCRFFGVLLLACLPALPPASPTCHTASQPASQSACLPSCNDETMELGLEKYKVLFNFRKDINSRYFNTSQNLKKKLKKFQREIIFSNVLIKNFLSAQIFFHLWNIGERPFIKEINQYSQGPPINDVGSFSRIFDPSPSPQGIQSFA